MQNISSSFVQTNARICIVIKQHRKLVHISLLTKEKATSISMAAQSKGPVDVGLLFWGPNELQHATFTWFKSKTFLIKKEKSPMILARKTLSIMRNTIFLGTLECTASKLENVGYFSFKVSILFYPRHHWLKITNIEFIVLIKFLWHCPFNHGQRGDHTKTARLILKVELYDATPCRQ